MLYLYGLDPLRLYVYAYEILRVTHQVIHLSAAILAQSLDSIQFCGVLNFWKRESA